MVMSSGYWCSEIAKKILNPQMKYMHDYKNYKYGRMPLTWQYWFMN